MNPRLTWDPEARCFRVSYPPVKHQPTTTEERKAAAKDSVSTLLRQAFGMTRPSGNSGLAVPAHMRKYVKGT